MNISVLTYQRSRKLNDQEEVTCTGSQRVSHLSSRIPLPLNNGGSKTSDEDRYIGSSSHKVE